MPDIALISEINRLSPYRIQDISNNWILLYLKSGSLNITLNSSVYKLSQNHIFLISPDDLYYLAEAEFAAYSAIYFNLKNPEHDLSSKVLELDGSEFELLESLFETDTIAEKQTRLELLLILLNGIDSNVPPIENKKARLFKKAVNIMERYIASSLSADGLAEMLRISLSTLKRIFSELSGLGIHEYFLMLKINKAKQFLLEGDTVTHTAKLLQFSSQAYFSAAFKRVVGISAKAFSMGKTEASPSPKRRRQNTARPSAQSRSSMPDYLL